MIRVRWIWPPLAALSVVVELGSPIALLGGKVTLLWAIGAWGFHMGVLLLMMIAFPYQMSGIAYASLFRVERPRLLRKIYTRLPSPPPPPPPPRDDDDDDDHDDHDDDAQ